MNGFTATAREETLIKSECYGEHIGVQMIAGLFPDQKWKAEKRGKYWYLTRAHSPACLRLTTKAMHRWFDLARDE